MELHEDSNFDPETAARGAGDNGNDDVSLNGDFYDVNSDGLSSTTLQDLGGANTGLQTVTSGLLTLSPTTDASKMFSENVSIEDHLKNKTWLEMPSSENIPYYFDAIKIEEYEIREHLCLEVIPHSYRAACITEVDDCADDSAKATADEETGAVNEHSSENMNEYITRIYTQREGNDGTLTGGLEDDGTPSESVLIPY